jgi:hypothetical protein
MRRLLHLAATLLLLGAATTHAQITNPDTLIAHPPANPPHHHAAPPQTYNWLWQFAKPTPQGDASALRVDARFQSLLAADFHQPQAVWGDHSQPLDAVIPLFLSANGEVTASENRYLSIDGCVPSFCPAHGLLWLDLGTPHPLAVFAAVNWTTENHTTDEASADYNLWLFSNRSLVADELPLALTEAIAHWDARLAAAHRLVPHIANAILVQPDGQPIALTPALTGANTLAPQPDTSTAASLTTKN